MFKNLLNRLFIVIIFTFSIQLSASTRTIYAAILSSSYEPWSYLDENSQYQGYNVDVLREIAKRLNYDLVIGEISQEVFLRSENSNAYNVYLSLKSPSIKEQLNFFFSKQYIHTPYQFIVNKGFYDQYAKDAKDIKNFNDLINFFQGKTIVVRKESASEALAHHYFRSSTISSHLIKDNVFENFDQGSRAFLLDSGIAAAIVKNQKDKFYLFGPEINSQNVEEVVEKTQSFAFPISQRKLQIMFDQTLEDMKKDGTLSKLSEKYFGRDFILTDHSHS